MKKFTILLVALFFGTAQLFAQLIDAEPEVTNLCTGGAATLTATITAPGTGTAPGSLPTTSYAISSIPYAPDPFGAGTGVTLVDDGETGMIPIGFNFCFFGNTYNQFVIGANNYIAFTAGTTTGTLWNPRPIPNTGFTRNAIMGPWQDINPRAGGSVTYAVYGTAPFRRLSVSWTSVPMFDCPSQIYSSEIIIYETSNVIETHILNKSICTTWQGGRATHGIQNDAGTVAFVVPGRNNTAWSASNEGTRFTPNGTATYAINWYILPANTLVGTGPSITVTPLTSPQYYYARVTGPNGCGPGGSNTDTVVVNSTSLAVDAGVYATVCSGTGTTLNASGGTSYSWSPATGLSNPAIANPVATPATTTTYTVTITGALGCTGTDTVTVGVNPAPFVDAGFGATMCSGDNITLGGNGSGTFSWSPATSLDNPTIANPVATPTTTTTYTLTVTTPSGCSLSDTVTIFIGNAAADAGANTAICFGTAANLAAAGGTSYSWSPAIGLSDPTIANPVANPTTTTTYTVLIADSGTGCSATDSVTVTVNPLPVADAGTNSTICAGSNTTLGASGGVNYAWTPTTSISDPTIFNPVASPTTTTTYSVTVTDASGCVSSDSVSVIVNPLPSVDAGSSFSICSGATAPLNATGATGYSWSPGATLSDSTIANPIANPTTETTYYVTGTDANGCRNTDSVTVSLNGLMITPGAGTAICSGASTTLSIAGASTYVWSPAATLSNPAIANPVATPTVTTTYTVIGTASNGCADTAFVTVIVNSLPPVNVGASLSICNGSTANLSVTGALSYVWTPAGSLSNPTIANPIATPTTTTLYTVVGTDVNGCTNSDTLTVIVHPIPTVSAGPNVGICMGSSVTLNATPGMLSYSWSPTTGLAGATTANPVATPTVTTTYTVTVMGAGFCSNTAQVTVTVNSMPTVTASADVAICNGASTLLAAPATSTGPLAFSWSPTTGLAGPTSALTYASPSATTTYTITVTTPEGCSATDEVTVTVNNALTMTTPSVVPETCFENDGVITSGAITGGAGTLLYTLNGGGAQSSPTFSGLDQGSYILTATDALGCSISQTVSVGQISNVNASFTATPTSGTSPLEVNFNNTSGGATSYFWDLGDGTTSFSTDPSDIYSAVGTYTVTLVASNGGFPCVDTARVTIEVYDQILYVIPNVFTPNGDNRNDVFAIQSMGVTDITGQIYNRWGKMVYEWKGDSQSGWDGGINGKVADDGTYYYVLRITGGDGKEHEEKGYFQLLGN